MKRVGGFLLSLLAVCSVYGQSTSTTDTRSDVYARWSKQTSAIQSRQPAWAVPLVTTYTGLFQVLRTDITRQITPARTATWNFDNSKGVNLIVPGNLELAVDAPPYIMHNTKAADGFGDFSFLVKYRIASGNEQHGSYTLSAFVLTTVPTGTYKNGSTNSSLTPALGAGKGFGRLDVQSTLGATLPSGSPATTTTGRPIGWNTAVQYHIGKLFFPEVESNATYYMGGSNDGRMQEFLTPGIVIGKCALHPERPQSRPGLAFGGGMQIATSHYHAYNHALVLTARWIY